MSKTSSAVKNRWNKENYDQLIVQLPKGMKDDFKAACEADGVSMNAVLRDAVIQYLESHGIQVQK